MIRVNELERMRYANLDDLVGGFDWIARAAYFVFNAANDAEAKRVAAEAMRAAPASQFKFAWHACPEILWSDGVARLVRVSAIADERLRRIAAALPRHQAFG